MWVQGLLGAIGCYWVLGGLRLGRLGWVEFEEGWVCGMIDGARVRPGPEST